MTTATLEKKDYRAAIERELRAHVERAAAPAGSPATAASNHPLDGLALVCLKCHGTNDADARFCTSCGEAFNAFVIALKPRRDR